MEEQFDAEAQRVANNKLLIMRRDNPEAFAHPYVELAEQAIKARFNSDSSVLSIWKKFSEDVTIPKKDLPQEFLNTVGLCGFTKGLKNALKCLLAQVSWEDSVFGVVKSIWSTLPLGSIEQILVGLPPQKQVEIRQKVTEKVGQFKPPWEMATSEKQKTRQQIKQEATEAKSYLDATIREFEIKYDGGGDVTTKIDNEIKAGKTKEEAIKEMATQAIADRESSGGGSSRTSQDIANGSN